MNSAQFGLHIMQLAYEMYESRSLNVYSDKDPSDYSKGFKRVCRENGLCREVFEHFVRDKEGWPLER